MSLDRPAHQLVATVIGAGTMGAQIAAHLANAGVRTHLLDIVPRDAKDRNALARGALATMAKGKPAPFMDPDFGARVTPGNIDDDLEAAVGKSDLVIEAVIERLDIKKPLFDRIAKAAPQHAVLATNTSGLPVGAIAADLPEAARRRVVGMHFFNPPRYMHLLEVVASEYTDPAVVAEVGRFSDHVLGKGVVPCRDTPNFIANRVGVAEMLLTFGIAFDDSYTVEEVDLLNGKLMGRPKMGSFRLGDLVGLDVAALVIGNLQKATSSDKGAPSYDELHDRMRVHPQLESMFERGMKGDKTGQGFYKKTDGRDAKGGRVVLTLDLATLEYRDRKEPKFPELDKIARMPLPARVAAALRAGGRAGDFLRKLWLPLFNYAANRLGEICDGPKEIDDAMRWGYAWTMGPFELWDAVGVKWAVEQMQAAGLPLAPATRTLLATAPDPKWYAGPKQAQTQFVPARKSHEPLPATEGVIVLDHLREAGKVIAKNDSATLLDLGDGIACVEFHSKMNSLGAGVLEILGKAVPTAKAKGMRAVVIGNQGENFSVGADAFMILALAGQSKWKELDDAVNTFQQTLMGLRHAELPVVVATHGMALGGGCETAMHGAAVVAAAESYIGLVEIGVGLLPAGGGLKEIVRRASKWAAQAPEGDPYSWVRRGFEKVAQAGVATSAHESRKAGWLRATDRIVFNKERVIAEAKRVAIALAEAGYEPPDRNEPIRVVGASRGASFLLGAQLFAWGGYASAHDKLIGEKIANVLSGGMSLVPRTVTAQDLLDLEREAFVSLCGEQKTRDRIAHMLSTGKPLRN